MSSPTPAQQAAWRRLWRLLLQPTGQENAAVGKTAAGTEASRASDDLR